MVRKNVGNKNDNPFIQQTDSLALKVSQSETFGQFSVSLKSIDVNEVGQTANVGIYNTLGQLIVQREMIVSPDQQVQFNLSNEAKGIYMIMVKTKDRVLHGKVVLQ